MVHPLVIQHTNAVRNQTAAVLVVWFLLALGGSLFGVFDSGHRPPIARTFQDRGRDEGCRPFLA